MIKSDSPRALSPPGWRKNSEVENIMYVYDEKSLAIRGYGGELGLKFTPGPPLTHAQSLWPCPDTLLEQNQQR